MIRITTNAGPVNLYTSQYTNNNIMNITIIRYLNNEQITIFA
jgi:hypothetical protein